VRVPAHNGSPQAAMQALEYGIDAFEHGYHLTEPVLRRMAKDEAWLIPTIVVSQPGARAFYQRIGSPDWYLARVDSVGKDHWAVLQQAIRLGVPIALGTDQFPFEDNEGTTATVREAELYVDAGMTPLQALQAATIQPARMMRRRRYRQHHGRQIRRHRHSGRRPHQEHRRPALAQLRHEGRGGGARRPRPVRSGALSLPRKP